MNRLDTLSCSFTIKTPCRWTEQSLCNHKQNEWSYKLYLSCKCVFTECRWLCVFCLLRLQHHDSVRLRQLWASPDEFTTRTEELGISRVNRSTQGGCSGCLVWILALSVTFHPLRVFKRLKHSCFLAVLCLFKAIQSLFSCQWVHCSDLPVDFKTFAKREETLVGLCLLSS